MVDTKRILAILRPSILFALVGLAGCNYNNVMCELGGPCGATTPPVDSPGTFSYYALTQFSNASGGNFCSYSTETWCTLDIQNNFAAQLKTDGWTNNPSY